MSAIVVNFNGGTDLVECIEGLRTQTHLPTEIIVVDNASHDQSLQSAQLRFPQVTAIVNDRNMGFAAAANQGAMVAGGDILFFVNPDVTVSPDCVQRLCERLDLMPGVAGAAISLDADADDPYGCTIDRLGYPTGLRHPGSPLYVAGSALATPRVLFRGLGGFDERYFMFVEDVDYCWRVLLAGFEVSVSRDARAKHRGGASAAGGYVRSGRLATTPFRFLLRERNSFAMLLKCAPPSWLAWLVPAHLCKSLLMAAAALCIRRTDLARGLLTALIWNVREIPRTYSLRRNVARTAVGKRVAIARIYRGLLGVEHLRQFGMPRFTRDGVDVGIHTNEPRAGSVFNAAKSRRSLKGVPNREAGSTAREGSFESSIRATRRLAAGVGVTLLVVLGFVSQRSVVDRVANGALGVLVMASLLACLEVILNRRRLRHGAEVKARLAVAAGPWPLLALVAATGSALAAQTWFQADASIAGGDIGPPDGLAWLRRLFAPWVWSGSDLGSPQTRQLQVPWALLVELVHLVGGNAVAAQRIWYTLLFASAAVGALLLLKTLGFRPLPAAIGAAVYVFNPYVLTLELSPVYLVALALVVAVPTGILAGARSHISIGTAAVSLGLCAPFFGYAYENPPLVGMVLAVAVGSPLLALWLWGAHEWRRASLATVLGLVFLLLASTYWIVPVAIQLHSTPVANLAAASSWTWTEVRATISNAFWLNTTWAWPDYFPFAANYSTPPLSILRFLLPATAFSALYISARNSESRSDSARVGLPVVAVASLVALFLLVFSTGTRPPGNWIFDALYAFPYGWLLREPGRFLMLAALAYAVLVAAFAERVSRIRFDRIWHAKTRMIPVGSGAVILLGAAISVGLSFPIAVGTVVPDAAPPLPSMHVKLPSYWLDMAAFVDRAPYDGAVLVAPPDDYYQMPYRWGYYGSDGFIPDLMNRSVLVPNPQGYFQTNAAIVSAVDLTTAALLRSDWSNAHRLLQSLGAQLILVRGDINAQFSGRSIIAPELLSAALQRAPNFALIHEAGPLALFADISAIPPRTSVAPLFATVDSDAPDLRALAFFPPGSVLVSAPGLPGVARVIQVPPLSKWELQLGAFQTAIPEPAGWHYKVGLIRADDVLQPVDPALGAKSLLPLSVQEVDSGGLKVLALRLPADAAPLVEPVVIGYPNITTDPPPQLLVLRESYSRDWTGPLNSRHVLVNGMVNGWLIASTGSVSSPKYAPADLVSMSLWLSGASFAFMFVVALALLVPNRVRSLLHGRAHH